ncbi:glycosyltransferase family 4 protein [Paenibacillus sp. FSL L8-0641]|uniref:glycosyltransferase family 4 protein n=1 Tax=Paenibacillus sp. FSL L8-0641 TaxID=2921605 RepID=UPI0030FC0C38
MKKRVAFVVQRYGLEVNGGAEYHCRLIAELLTDQYEVDVLTTKALDYMTWENFYKYDLEEINGVKVRRFEVSKPRNVQLFNQKSDFIFNNKKESTYFDEHDWMWKQGPASIDLLQYLKNYHQDYVKVIFFTYNYFTTYYGVHLIPEKSILIPTAHDEPPIYLSLYKSLFHLPRHILFNTHEEKDLVHKLFHNEHVPNEIVGVGVNKPMVAASTSEQRLKLRLPENYFIYVGRIDESKGCKELFEYYLKYKSEQREYPKLVLVGKSVMGIPKDPDIVPLGFVTEEEKFTAISESLCMVMPSKYESLSMSVLESLSMSTPVIVNGHSDVLKGHCERGNAGLYYTSYEEFKACLDLISDEKSLRERMGENGVTYVEQFYNWDAIKESYVIAIEN